VRRIFITGGTGFVGSHLVRFLKPSKAKIVSASSSKSRCEEPGVEYLKVDIRNPDEVRAAVREVVPSEIYHLAGVSAVDASWNDPRLTFDVNVLGSYNVFEAAMKLSSPPRILNVSTSQVYARSASPLTESSPLGPENPYAATKAMAELLTVQYRKSTSGGIITARAFNHAGPGQLANFVLSSMAKQFAEVGLGLRPASLALGNVDVKRDFTDVRDVVRAYKMLIDEGNPGEIYNVCSGKKVGLREVIDMFRALLNVDVTIDTDAKKVRSNDADTIWGDPSKIRQQRGWFPHIALAKTLQDMLTYWQEKLHPHHGGRVNGG
jgi:GDP-4-dehydro-6-deoxy-D-mannose reductase